MMMKKTFMFLLLLVTVGAHAAEISFSQVDISNENFTLTSNDAEGSFSTIWDNISQELTTNGTISVTYALGAGPTLFTHIFTDLVLNVATGMASATAFECVEGSYGDLVGFNACGGFGYGGNLVSDSTISYGSGATYNRTMGGDDVVFATEPVNLSLYNPTGLSFNPLTGELVIMGASVGTGWNYSMAFNNVSNVPLPASIYLFGSGLFALFSLKYRLRKRHS